MLRNRLQGRASQTLVGLGRLLHQLCNEDGLVAQLHLQQALRTFHISLTPEVSYMYNIIIHVHTVQMFYRTSSNFGVRYAKLM